MYSRFIDKRHTIDKDSGFVHRNHGVSLFWIILSFIAACGLITLPVIFYEPNHALFLGSITCGIMIILGTLVVQMLKRNFYVIDVLELQNALFAGAARLATEFCIILKHDGSVIYVDPKYNARFFHLRNQGMDDFDALCESGNIGEKAKKRLLSSLKEGRSDQIEFTVPNIDNTSQALTLNIDPIGTYVPQELTRKLHLAVQPIARPSGYFFLRAKHISVEEEYRECLNMFNMGYYKVDHNHNITSVNKTFLDITGYAREDLITGIVPFEHIFCESEHSAPIRQQQTYSGQIDLLCANANIKPVLVSQIITYDSHTDQMVSHGLICEIHVPKESNQQAQHYIAQNPLNLLDDLPIPTLLLSDEGEILKQNTPCEQLLTNLSDKQDKKLTINNLFDIVTKEKRDELASMFHNITNQDQTSIAPIDLPIHGDDNRIISLYLSHLDNQEDQRSMVIGQLIDTTELKNLELRFAHSQKMQAVGQLAGGIAHDFNNLLTAMLGFCDLLLLRHPAGDKSFPEIMQIKQNANRAANLVRQLLAFSRKQTLQPKIIDITNTLADLSNLIRRLIGENMALKITHGRDLGKVKVDQGQLEQVIINLAVNARDAMPEGGILAIETVNITIADEKENLTTTMTAPADDETIEAGEYVYLQISDTGHGIDKQVINSIFEPFFSTKEVGSGTGLGLSTVYGIIKQTNGYIYVTSTENEGTTFHIFLKSYRIDDQEEKEQTNQPTKVEQHIDLSGQGTVLLVEDEAPVRIFSANALSKKGYDILEADCAEAALEIIKTKGDEIDVIVTDVVMPGMNGPTMIKQISPDYPNIKVIFVSGYGEDEFIKSYGQERSFNFLSKPYTLKQLALKVKEVMK